LVYLNPPAADSKNEEKKNGDFWKPENQATQFSPFFLRARRQWSTPRILLIHSFGPSAQTIVVSSRRPAAEHFWKSNRNI
jgi:hypothetical protein